MSLASALGQKRTCAAHKLVSAYPRKRHQMRHNGMSAKGQRRTSVTSFGGRDVLIHAEQVCRIIALLDFSQAVVALPICRANPIRTFVHHEIYVSTSR